MVLQFFIRLSVTVCSKKKGFMGFIQMYLTVQQIFYILKVLQVQQSRESYDQQINDITQAESSKLKSKITSIYNIPAIEHLESRCSMIPANKI